MSHHHYIQHLPGMLAALVEWSRYLRATHDPRAEVMVQVLSKAAPKQLPAARDLDNARCRFSRRRGRRK